MKMRPVNFQHIQKLDKNSGLVKNVGKRSRTIDC